ncbi:MAG: HAMP domain-containing sensor histidine kinase [Anaerolineaceae bacterium]|nr:HAMP domain-containing sensor histidine kinase [Anaerolineaceae bacterium]
MLSSLRDRLWLSYALLIAIALVIVGVGLIVSFQTSPLLYRQQIQRMRQAETNLGPGIDALLNKPALLEATIQREGTNRSLRLVILNLDGSIVADSDSSSGLPLPAINTPIKATLPDALVLPLATSSNGTVWIYTISILDAQHFLMVTIPRPVLPIFQIIRDDVFTPFIRAGAVVLLVAFLVSLAMSRWITRPLDGIAKAARSVAKGDYQPIPPTGPDEVKQLAQAFNEMVHRVQSSQKSQQDLIANVSHELKTPLTSIQGFAQAILDGTAQTPEALQQAAGVIYNESGRMNRLVMDLLTLARLEGGTADLHHEPVNMEALLRRVVEKFVPQAQQAQLNLQINLSPMPLIVGDGDRLAQVFTNLVDNAIKFTPPGGLVTINSSASDGSLTVKVADTGSGIPSEDQQRIFERFYQADKSRRGGSGRGIGLGLPIARQIILSHGGDIRVESSPSKGSTFIVKLPVIRSTDQTLNIRKIKA